MKKVKFFMVILAVALFAAACEKEGETISSADVVAGSYDGTLSFSVMGADQGSLQTQVVIARAGAGSVKVTLKGDPDAESAMAIKGDISVENVALSVNGETYVLAETNVDAMVGTTNYKGKLAGTVTGNNAVLTFTLTPGAMPMPITAVFKGTK